MQRIKKAAATIGWDCPLLTFIYLGFDCGSPLWGLRGVRLASLLADPAVRAELLRGQPFCHLYQDHRCPFQVSLVELDGTGLNEFSSIYQGHLFVQKAIS